VNLHHGFIEVTSILNKGTVFTVHIPIDRMSYVDSELNIPDKMIYDSSGDLTRNAENVLDMEEIAREDTVMLLVEDNEELLILMYHIFSRRYKVLTAKNGIEAMKILKNKEVDIIISDVIMPEMDGLELCRKLKSDLDTSHIPVILLTAKNSTEDRIDCYNVGANGYISKPFDIKLLKARITNFLINKRQKQNEFRFNRNINVSLLQISVMDKKFLDKAIAVIQDNIIDTDFDVNILADKLYMSKSSLYRKIKSITGISPVEFIRNIRIKYAMRMLKEDNCTISEAAYSSGFSNPKYFATCFKEEFNMTPSEYMKKH
jgi:YesN/AraC family two-component response regulator